MVFVSAPKAFQSLENAQSVLCRSFINPWSFTLVRSSWWRRKMGRIYRPTQSQNGQNGLLGESRFYRRRNVLKGKRTIKANELNSHVTRLCKSDPTKPPPVPIADKGGNLPRHMGCSFSLSEIFPLSMQDQHLQDLRDLWVHELSRNIGTRSINVRAVGCFLRTQSRSGDHTINSFTWENKSERILFSRKSPTILTKPKLHVTIDFSSIDL